MSRGIHSISAPPKTPLTTGAFQEAPGAAGPLPPLYPLQTTGWLGGVRTVLLLDTGAAICAFDPAQLFDDMKVRVLRNAATTCKQRVKTAQGAIMQATLEITMDVQLGGHRFRTNMLWLPGLSPPAIIGMDALRREGAVIDLPGETITFKSGAPAKVEAVPAGETGCSPLSLLPLCVTAAELVALPGRTVTAAGSNTAHVRTYGGAQRVAPMQLNTVKVNKLGGDRPVTSMVEVIQVEERNLGGDRTVISILEVSKLGGDRTVTPTVENSKLGGDRTVTPTVEDSKLGGDRTVTPMVEDSKLGGDRTVTSHGRSQQTWW